MDAGLSQSLCINKGWCLMNIAGGGVCGKQRLVTLPTFTLPKSSNPLRSQEYRLKIPI